MKNDVGQRIALLLGMVVIAYFLWDTPIIYPIKIFVVILHELSHGLAALLCGGKIIEIAIDPNIGGYCRYIAPDNFFYKIFIASAGYLGSIFWGCSMLFLAIKCKSARIINGIISIVVIVMALLFVRQLFGFVFCLLYGLVMGAISFKLPHKVNDIIVQFIALVSCLYAVIDIKEDLIVRSGIGSDSDAIAAMLGIPALSIVIGIFWMILSIAAVTYTFHLALPLDSLWKDKKKADTK